MATRYTPRVGPSPLPPFCRRLVPSPQAQHNAVAVTDGRIGAWPVPAGSRLWFTAKGELLEMIPAREVTLEGLPFAAHKRVGFVWGRPFRGTLARDIELAGTPCRGGVETLVRPVDGGWYPLDGELAAESVVDGFDAMAGTRFQRLDAGRLVLFTPARDVVIDGIPCRGGDPVRRHGGRVTVATLAKDAVIDGVPCAAGGPVHVGAGGLTHARLRVAWTARGVSWRAGTLVSGALRDGVVSEGTLDADAAVDGYPLAGGTTVAREPGRELVAFTLARDAVVDGFPCRAGTCVRRRDVRSYTLAGSKAIRGVVFGAGDVVTIDEWDDYDAGVPVVRLAAERVIRGRAFPAGSAVHLYGWLCLRITVRLGDAAVVDGVAHPAQTLIEFDRRDRVARVHPPKREAPFR